MEVERTTKCETSSVSYLLLQDQEVSLSKEHIIKHTFYSRKKVKSGFSQSLEMGHCFDKLTNLM